MGGGTVFPFCALSCAAVAKELFAVFITFYFACSFVIEENRRFCRKMMFSALSAFYSRFHFVCFGFGALPPSLCNVPAR